LAFATFLVWRLRAGACGVGVCGFWRYRTPPFTIAIVETDYTEGRLGLIGMHFDSAKNRKRQRRKNQSWYNRQK